MLPLLAVFAIMVDVQAPEASFYLARCSASDQWFDPAQWLRAGDHLRAFPWSLGVMVLMCAVGPQESWRPWLRSTVVRMALMGATMPVSCALAWAVSSATLPVAWQMAAFAALMLIAGGAMDASLCGFRRPVRSALMRK